MDDDGWLQKKKNASKLKLCDGEDPLNILREKNNKSTRTKKNHLCRKENRRRETLFSNT